MDPEDPESSIKRVNIKIREMEIDDIAQVFHLGEELFKADEIPTMYRTWDTFEVTTLYNSDTEFCLVAEDDDAIVGFALGTTIIKEHSAWKYGYLIWLGVLPGYQKNGVGDKLFNRFKDLMLKNGVRMMIVDTPAENKRALKFFNKMGFGPPQPHVYLTLNLAADQQRLKNKPQASANGRTNGNGRSNGNGHGNGHGQAVRELACQDRNGR
jgi:ribosomal protein S18 acetylase RimI-like enzyme